MVSYKETGTSEIAVSGTVGLYVIEFHRFKMCSKPRGCMLFPKKTEESGTVDQENGRGRLVCNAGHLQKGVDCKAVVGATIHRNLYSHAV